MTNRDFALTGLACQEGDHCGCLTLTCQCFCHEDGSVLKGAGWAFLGSLILIAAIWLLA